MLDRVLPWIAIVLAVAFGAIAVLEVDRRGNEDDIAVQTAAPLPSALLSPNVTPEPTATPSPTTSPTEAPTPSRSAAQVSATLEPTDPPSTPTTAPATAEPTVAPTPTASATAIRTLAPADVVTPGPTDDTKGPMADTGANPVPAGLAVIALAVVSRRALFRRSSY